MSGAALTTRAVQENPPPADVRGLEQRLSAYLAPEQVARVRRAYEVGALAHEGQTRKSGEPYITHPVAVAGILAELGMDAETIIAAILHDTLEDTKLTSEQITAEFGANVTELVDGVTKLDKVRFRSRQEAAAESFRKMLLAMARDLRVILIKLADRLHNMRTLGAVDAESRRRIARETLDIYAPIAQRLGMNRFKSELQDLGFRTLYPDRHRVIAARIRSVLGNRREAMARIEHALDARLARRGHRASRDQPHQVAVLDLFEDEERAQVVRADDGRVRLSRRRRFGRALLSGARRGARAVQAARRPLQGFHRDPEGERLPVAAHRAVRAVRRADRDPDPHRGHGRDRRARRRRALGLQDRCDAGQQRAEPRARMGVRSRRSRDIDAFVARVHRERQDRSLPRRGVPVHAARARSWRCRATRPRSISRISCTPTSATTRSPHASTRSSCRCARGFRAGRASRSSPRRRRRRARSGSNGSSRAARARRSASI